MTGPNTTLLVLDSLSLDSARAIFDQLDRDTGLIPETGRAETAAALDRLTASANKLGIGNMGGLCRNIATVLQHASQIAKITGPLRTVDADRLHDLRNTALAWAIGCVLTLDQKAQPVTAVFPTLWARTTRRERPRTNDEILLLRAAVLDRLRRAKGVKCAGVYAMVDAGAAPAETTAITPKDFDADLDGQPPTFMLIPHFTAAIEDRAVNLDRFASYVLGQVLDHTQAEGTRSGAPITYTSRNGGPNAPSASVSKQLANLAETVGLRHADTVPASIRRWRIQTVFDHQGIDAATSIAGEKADRLPLLINIPDNNTDDETSLVTSFLAA